MLDISQLAVMSDAGVGEMGPGFILIKHVTIKLAQNQGIQFIHSAITF